ncbi:hypothetical protein FHS18_003165 [Paenibacillus phyllosphaerae]|uniref:Uncharacterized protein n=1 Tax=Paenibacillus phyllosphaerae TaxID=274593 RepID=A0A7W5AYJ7_9BACL|nr:hypothetical protein [Paenibacillus phyllosphaerae]MBB3111097.1 hypothetical protein [Paenibacillus phyllosphaerae]
MTALGTFVLALTGILLMAMLDTLVYQESLFRALMGLLPDSTRGPLAMIIAALLIALWADLKQTGWMKKAMARLSGWKNAWKP